jgi:hypothetical protein
LLLLPATLAGFLFYGVHMTTETNETPVSDQPATEMTTEELLAMLAATPIVKTECVVEQADPPEDEEVELFSPADQFVQRCRDEDHTDLIDDFTSLDAAVRLEVMETLSDMFDSGDMNNGFILAYWDCHCRHVLSSENLMRLRQLIGKYEDADDWSDIRDMLTDDFDCVECDDCGELEFSDRTKHTYNEDNICRECADNNYRYSDHYECYVHDNSSRWAYNQDGDEVLIHENDDDFYYNDDIDRWVHREYEAEIRVIGSYHSSKGRINLRHDDWTRQNKRFFGVELETEIKIDYITKDKAAERLHDLINGGSIGKNIFFENDGSLNYGFEMVTHPMSLPAHRELWKFLQDKEAIKYMRSHNTSSCGLHVHVSRRGLSSLQIAKIVTFINNRDNEQLIRAVARRYADGYCKIKDKTIGKSCRSEDRYEAVNITPRETIEFRIFKGSLKYESVVSAIEFAHAITEFCKPSVTSIKDLNADKFLDYCAKEMPEETAIMRPYISARIEND